MSNANLIAEARRNAPESVDGNLLSRLANALEEAEANLALAEGGATWGGMSAGMAEVIAAHNGYQVKMPNGPNAPFIITCSGCGDERPIINEVGNVRTSPQRHAAHVADELTKAGYGKVRT